MLLISCSEVFDDLIDPFCLEIFEDDHIRYITASVVYESKKFISAVLSDLASKLDAQIAPGNMRFNIESLEVYL